MNADGAVQNVKAGTRRQLGSTYLRLIRQCEGRWEVLDLNLKKVCKQQLAELIGWYRV